MLSHLILQKIRMPSSNKPETKLNKRIEELKNQLPPLEVNNDEPMDEDELDSIKLELYQNRKEIELIQEKFNLLFNLQPYLGIIYLGT